MIYEYQDYVSGGIQSVCKSVCKVNLALGSTAIGHSTISAKMFHTILTLSAGWANGAHHHSGTFWGQQLYCSCVFLVLHRHSRISLPWKCLALWAMWNTLNPSWETDEGFSKQGLSHFRVAAQNQIPNMCWCRLRVQALGLHVASWHLPLICTASCPGDMDMVPVSHCQPPVGNTSIRSADLTLESYGYRAPTSILGRRSGVLILRGEQEGYKSTLLLLHASSGNPDSCWTKYTWIFILSFITWVQIHPLLPKAYVHFGII